MMRFDAENIHDIVATTIRVLLYLALLGSLFELRWSLVFSCTLILVATYIPHLFEKNYKINLPTEFELFIIIFIYASLYLGEIQSYYDKYWWWDIFLHTGSGIALGFVGFLLLYVLYHKGTIQANPIWIAIFAFSFGVALGAVWEIFEFSMDQIFGLNMQRSGLVDTMWDLIVDSIGALITSIIGYYYLKGNKIPLFTRMLQRFEKDNKHLRTKTF